MRDKPITMINIASRMEKKRGICHLPRKETIEFITKAKSTEIVKGRITEEVTFNTAPADMQAIKARRKKFARPELKLLKGSFMFIV
jgi:dihydroorotase-like cyclic amidohydrolase